MSIEVGEMRMKNRGRDDTFLECDLIAKEPYGQFKAWFEEACANKNILEPNAMCVSTVSREGKPSARYVLCKSICKEGFKFFTNYESRKAKDLESNKNIALTFYWDVLNRSVRIEGVAEKVSDEESEKYFHSRPVPSQIIACTSRQSEPIESREVLYEREKHLEVKYKNSDKQVPKPKLWGGYLVRPTSMEFWQGQQDRLSDRINFRKPSEGEVPDGKILHQGEDGWVYERLSP